MLKIFKYYENLTILYRINFVTCGDTMDYFDRLEKETHHLYEIANEARSKGLDVETETEVPLAKDLAERVEGLVGPEGVAQRIKELEKDMDRESVAFEIAAEIASSKFELTGEKAEWDVEQRCDQGLRTALAILTEGVVAAPLEGISDVKIKDNFDGTKYIGVYFAGPIRSAGGTAAALAVLLGDKIRQAIDIDEFKPIEDEIERYVEEVELYESEVTNLQYSPTPEEVRFAANHIPVEVSGEQTDQVEVSHRDLQRVETNNIRGGALLAMVEGVIQKSKKIKKIANKLGLDWDWLEEYSKPKTTESTEDSGDSDIVSEPKYIQDIIGGRPILGYPSEKGAFRLRYGRSRNTGLATMGVHPATMALLEFLAVGTQLKIEYPGKGNCVVPVDSIEGPIVKLKNGDVVIIDSVRQARELKKDVDEILFLGDMLVAFGEFLRNNQPLYPSGWVEEWWIQLLMQSENFDKDNNDLDLHKLEYEYLSSAEALTLSKNYNIPLHPKYTYCYNDVTIEDLNALIELIEKGKKNYKPNNELILDLSYPKRVLEVIGVPHTVRDGKIVIDKDHAYALLVTLPKKLPEKDSTLEAVNEISPIEIKNKAPAYIGTRVGRPEKSKERLMRPAPHGLFPIGNNGGSRRLIATAAKKGSIKVEIARRKCTNPSCGISSNNSLCPKCGSPTEIGKPSERSIPLASMLKKASDNVKVRRVDEVKGVVGMISESKLAEPLEKGILRAKNEVFTFKDGTIRHDSTDLPLTHFIPKEIGVTVEKLKEMGYEKDCYGNPIENEDQIIELRVQDIVISNNCGEYLLRTAKFIDDELTRFYGMEPFYNVKEKSDLIGHLVAGLAPHTSAGVLGRIVGFTKALGCYAHPYFHSAKRRNCDSDEDAIMLLLDSILNFSKSYLPNTRGGSMDAPLVLSTRIDPEEIDDESHNLDIFERFPVEFYEKTFSPLKPAEVLEYIDNVEMHLGTPQQYEGLMFSHHTSNIHAGPTICLYKTLPSMREKVEAQISLAEKIRAVDQRGVVEKVLSSHFLPDIMGNSRAFSKQKVRCTKCGSKYRRIPLTGKCQKCGGNLILSVSKGSVTKYLEISQELINRYPISPYLRQRLEIQEFGIKSLFESDKSKQSSLDVFF